MTGIIIALFKQYRKPLTAFALAALLLWGFGHWRFITGQDEANQSWQQRWSARDSADSLARADREARERAEEQRRQQVVNEEQKRADDELAKVQASADAAERARNGLQQQLRLLQRKLGDSETGRLSALAAAGQAKTETTRVLAIMLGESDRRAGIYAEEADERYAAGSVCERTYDKVTRKNEHE